MVIHHEHRGRAGCACGLLPIHVCEQSTRSGVLLTRAGTEPLHSNGGRRALAKLFGEEVLDLMHAQVG
jgi:hypothetical protein